jgi:hypothetical protein
MFEHIVHQNWATGHIICVIKRNVGMKFAITKVEVKNGQAAAAAQKSMCRLPAALPAGLPIAALE